MERGREPMWSMLFRGRWVGCGWRFGICGVWWFWEGEERECGMSPVDRAAVLPLGGFWGFGGKRGLELRLWFQLPLPQIGPFLGYPRIRVCPDIVMYDVLETEN